MKKEEKAQRMAALIDQLNESGLSVPAFCEREGLKEHQLYYWRRRCVNSLESSGFTQVTVVTREASVRMELPGGLEVGLSGLAVVGAPFLVQIKSRHFHVFSTSFFTSFNWA